VRPVLTTLYMNLLLFQIPAWFDDEDIQAKRSSIMEFLRLVRIVLSSFFGVRNSASHEADIANVNFVLLPFVAVFLAVFIGAIIFGFVHLITHSTSTMQGF